MPNRRLRIGAEEISFSALIAMLEVSDVLVAKVKWAKAETILIVSTQAELEGILREKAAGACESVQFYASSNGSLDPTVYG